MSGKKKGLGRGLSALFGDEKSNDKRQEIRQSNHVMGLRIILRFFE